MIIEGKFTVKAPIQKLWDTLFDVQALAACLPGTEEIKQLDDKTYEVTMKQKVGIIKVTMKGKQTLTKVEPPTHLEMEGEAEDMTKLGRMKDKVTMDLKDIGGGEVEISYNIDVSMVGKLAMFGDRVMRSKATEVEREFVKNLSARLSSVA
ncbi:MAG TPA: SRPBCC domain-containing protein [Syntrophorhabdus sp.]|jgi:carbon monoxide dehydrogenase subunit G|nr:SRPBCC family protein [Syntrophorhabdus sp.]MDI9557421.1 SRPBCC domain-containing protein [Pseudomonadota bacterium]OPX93427.1 MAG: Carbon monoxide dehydrogenase subunit G (CoxG) [Syntrophorhabdus sp. PtaB.Bin027]OQB73962.1 MAG: Carbon monoxide dehydrogenase subunit G (CoxG) [Deltaproteobacteria bacterium ADurb.Bin135]MBP8745599.1 SRPBCC family protein [Syntrophorhabdus sp.]